MATKWSELFPTKLSLIIFLGYMSLFVAQGILITASQETNNSYKYNTVTVVLFTEVLKLLVSTVLYIKSNGIQSLSKDVQKDLPVMMLYFVPAFLYCLYNNLAFVNLSTFDPTTYYLLLQLRVVATGILFQIIFKKYLTRKQWISLIILTVGCMIKQISIGVPQFPDAAAVEKDTSSTPSIKSGDAVAITKNMAGFDLSISAIFIIAQTICSCLAGVYNEYLLKDKGSDVDIFIQNIFMYLDSIVCNVIVLLLQGELFDALTYDNLKHILRFNVIIIIINNAAIGIVTSFFLKYMNSILKTFASALELVFTAVLSYIFFSIPIYFNTILSITLVSCAIYMYSQSPVVNLGKLKTIHSRADDTKRLLNDECELQMEEV